MSLLLFIWHALMWLFIAIGLFFNSLGVFGILRFPDVYTRLHADTKATTFGTIFTSLAVVIYGLGHWLKTADGQYGSLVLHTLIAVVVLAITNATGAHAIARAALRRGHQPARAVVNKLEDSTS